ncbi:MAG TPA: hydroxymethylbilane synthase [Terriglobia bacterium]|nr:hydroxymethylbilane synthase [Terriglobia bacterium]
MTITIGSRGSKLALWQAEWVRAELTTAGHKVGLRVIKTTGDKLPEASLAQSGAKGLFIKEIEEALLSGAVDVAVHSLKDLPVEQPPGLEVAAIPRREDPRDVFLSRDGCGFADLVGGARVGTSSLRRESQLRYLCPDVDVVPMRGNIDTRLAKLERGDCDALVLAAAGLLRLGVGERISQYFPVEQMCPAVGQGALAIEIRNGDAELAAAVSPLDDVSSHRAVTAERAVLRRLGGGCSVPIAAHAFEQAGPHHDASLLHLIAVVASPDGKRLVRARGSGLTNDPGTLGDSVAQDLLRQGAREILNP